LATARLIIRVSSLILSSHALFSIKTCHLLKMVEIKFQFPFQGPYNINTPTQVFVSLRYRAIYDLQEFNFKKGLRKPSDLKTYSNGYIQDHRKSASYDQDYSCKGNYPINYSERSYNQPSTLYSLQTPNYTFSAITHIPPASSSKSTTTLSQYHINGGYRATD
jgi:hypothetical protein